MNCADIENEIRDNIKTLSRGLIQSNYQEAYEGYKNLYSLGQVALEPLKAKIGEIDWSQSKYKELSKYVSGIFSLIHDIDENVADNILEKLTTDGCPDHIKALLRSTCEFSLKNYKKYKIRGIEIFEHKEIKKGCIIQDLIGKWLKSVTENDLSDISRLYIIRKEDIDNWAGTYTPVLFKIAVVWDNPYKANSLRFWLFSLFTEHTLYHEIGHHIHRHKFGTDADQEKEADRYASKIISNNHRYLSYLVNFLSKLGLKSNTNYYRWGL